MAVIKEWSDDKRILIECDCGAHILQLSSMVEFMQDEKEDRPRVRQDINLAMFNYGYRGTKDNFWRRIAIAFRYLRKGEMHADQLVLRADEAQKMVDFLKENIVDTEPETSGVCPLIKKQI